MKYSFCTGGVFLSVSFIVLFVKTATPMTKAQQQDKHCLCVRCEGCGYAVSLQQFSGKNSD